MDREPGENKHSPPHRGSVNPVLRDAALFYKIIYIFVSKSRPLQEPDLHTYITEWAS